MAIDRKRPWCAARSSRSALPPDQAAAEAHLPDVVHVAPRPHEQAMVFPPLQRPANPGAVRVLFCVRHMTAYALAVNL